MTTHNIQPGETFELTLHIHDTTDQVLDSLAILDDFQWTVGPVEASTIAIAPAP